MRLRARNKNASYCEYDSGPNSVVVLVPSARQPDRLSVRSLRRPPCISAQPRPLVTEPFLLRTLIYLSILLMCTGVVAGCQGQSQVESTQKKGEEESATTSPKTSFKKAVDSADRLNSLAAQHNQAIKEQAGE